MKRLVLSLSLFSACQQEAAPEAPAKPVAVPQAAPKPVVAAPAWKWTKGPVEAPVVAPVAKSPLAWTAVPAAERKSKLPPKCTAVEAPSPALVFETDAGVEIVGADRSFALATPFDQVIGAERGMVLIREDRSLLAAFATCVKAVPATLPIATLNGCSEPTLLATGAGNEVEVRCADGSTRAETARHDAGTPFTPATFERNGDETVWIDGVRSVDDQNLEVQFGTRKVNVGWKDTALMGLHDGTLLVWRAPSLLKVADDGTTEVVLTHQATGRVKWLNTTSGGVDVHCFAP